MDNSKKNLDPDYLFNIFKLNKYFAIGSILLLGSVLWMVNQDYDREWKQWQRKFRLIDLEKTQKEISSTKEELKGNSEYQTALAELEKARTEGRKREVEIYKLEKEIVHLESIRYKVFAEYQNQKSMMDSLVYDLDEARHENRPSVNKIEAKVSKQNSIVAIYKTQLEDAEKNKSTAQAQLDSLNKEKKDREDATKKLESQLTRLTKKEHAIEHSFANDVFRNAPMLDFIDPSLKIKEIVVSDIRFDYNFTKVPRADVCVTCHIAIDKPGFEDQKNPLKTHPRLELFLSNKSPHKLDEFGCTVCHLGSGGSLTFNNAAHSPSSEEQKKEWEKKYHWTETELWEEPMLPLKYTEATCLGCHSKDVEVPGANHLNRGIRIVERGGCYGCHKIEGWQGIRSAGPSLKRITSKVTPEWMYKWIRSPKLFRPTTNMPQFFDNSNNNDPTSRDRSTTEILSIIAYLKSKAEPFEPNVTLKPGNVERGKKLIGTVGCLGCHKVEDHAPITEIDEAKEYSIKRPFGPSLNEIGSKVSPQWLTSWLKNPKNYWNETRMPNLRLTDTEVADLVAYLTTKRNETFEKIPVPKQNPSKVQQVLMDHMIRRMPQSDAIAEISKMTPDEKEILLGQKLIALYGCFSCHTISGFEDTKPIGTELTQEASKPLARFDFAFVNIDKSVSAWIRQKLHDPRSYDMGKMREPLDKLRMPNFGFAEDELDDVVTFVLGLRKYLISDNKKPPLTPQRVAVQQGRRMIHDNNCRGCHILEGMGGEVLSYYEDRSSGPPNLKGEGQKIQQPWIYNFFANISTIRPWLNIRMPSFGFDGEHRNTLIAYFRGLDGLTPKVEETPPIEMTKEKKALALDTFKTFQCSKCHKAPPYSKDTDMTNLAPSFRLAKERLRYEWIDKWLKDPSVLLPGTRMPNLFYSEGQPLYPDADARIYSLRDYLYTAKDVYSLK